MDNAQSSQAEWEEVSPADGNELHWWSCNKFTLLNIDEEIPVCQACLCTPNMCSPLQVTP